MAHLVIAGHGWQKNKTFDPGATGYIKKGEHKYVVEDLFPSMKKQLPKGHNVIFYHEKKVSNYGNLVQLARQFKAKQVTEIHFDAHTLGSSARGGHVIIHKNFSPDKMDLALRDAIKNMVGVRYSHKGHEGISGRDNLYNVNQAAQNGITYRLIELGFGTNKLDADIMVKNVDDYARELVKAITGTVVTVKSSNAAKAVKKPQKQAKTNVKSISQMVQEVIDGKHGNGHAQRKKSLGISSNEYKKVRDRVNAVASGKQNKPTTTKTVQQMANEVKKGLHGNGHENRRKSLGISKSEYEKVRKLVNTGIHPSSSKTVSQMAKEVIDGKHGQGHANRRKSLGISQAQYNKVRAEVNKQLK